MKLPEFNLFSDKSARIFLIFPSICPNFHGFPKFEGSSCPPVTLSRTPMHGDCIHGSCSFTPPGKGGRTFDYFRIQSNFHLERLHR